MKRKIFNSLFLVLILSYGCKKTDKEILDKTVHALKSLSKVEFQTITHYKQKDMGINVIDTSLCYFDFTTEDSLIGTKYQLVINSNLVANKKTSIYNGKQQFSIEGERVIYINKPKLHDVANSFCMRYSIWSMRKLLPKLINDSAVVIKRFNDTIINGNSNYVFNILIKGSYLGLNDQLVNKKGAKDKYNMYISKKSFLPTQIRQDYPNNKGYWIHSISNYNLTAIRPDSIWKLDKFPKNYLRLTKDDFIQSLRNNSSVQIGEKAKDWELPLLNSNDSIKLSKLSSSLVLIEFWFPYCGGCLKCIPELNNINSTYLDKGLRVYGIEFRGAEANFVSDYVKKQKIEYPILYSGEEVAKKYCINAAPTFYLIDKKGVILYSSIGLNIKELQLAINKNL